MELENTLQEIKAHLVLDGAKPDEIDRIVASEFSQNRIVEIKQMHDSLALAGGKLPKDFFAKEAQSLRTIISSNLDNSKTSLGNVSLTRGCAMLAGIGLIGHGAYQAVAAVDEGKDGQRQRNWTKTLLHGAEAAAGAGMTWVSLVEGKQPAALRR